MGEPGVAAVSAAPTQIPGSVSKDVLIHANKSFDQARHRRTRSKSKNSAGASTTSSSTSSGTNYSQIKSNSKENATSPSPDDYLPHGSLKHHHNHQNQSQNQNQKRNLKTKNKKDLDWAQYLDQRQLKFASIVLASVLLLHQIPSIKPYTSRALYLQYVNPKNGLARAGFDDIYFVLFWIIGFVFVRAIFVQHILIWISHNLAGIKSDKLTAKFAEQSWYFIHYSASFIAGFYIISGEDYMTSVEHLWIGWPHYELRPFVKIYYLAHVSLWMACIYTLQVETRRKDHYQMTTHHIIASILCLASHFHYYTRVGIMISVYMDFADIQLAAAKILNYLKYKKLCDISFLLFMIGWIVSRHVLYNYTTWSAMTDAFELIEDKCYYDDNGELVQCFSKTVHWRLVSLLIALQVILLIWFARVIKVLISVIKGTGAQDNRSSDDETYDDEEDDKEGEQGQTQKDD